MEVEMTGFADLSEVLAARAGIEGLEPPVDALVSVPNADSSEGHWACYLWQTCRGTWQDVADGLEMSFGTTYRRAQAYAKEVGLPWPLEKRLGERRKVRETVRGAR